MKEKLKVTIKTKIDGKYSDIKHDGITKDSMFVKKFFDTQPQSVNLEERTISRYITTPNLDYDSEIVDPDGVDLSFFEKNPIVLFAHDSFSYPIGKDISIIKDKHGILATTKFHEHTEEAKQAFNLVKDGYINANSIGFLPVEWVWNGEEGFAEVANKISKNHDIPIEEVKKARIIYPKVILLEHSDVPVAANPYALNKAFGSGSTDEINNEGESNEGDMEVEELSAKLLQLEEKLAELDRQSADSEAELEKERFLKSFDDTELQDGLSKLSSAIDSLNESTKNVLVNKYGVTEL